MLKKEQDVKLLPKLRNNTEANIKNFMHHVSFTAPKLSLPGSLPGLFEQAEFESEL